MSYVVGGGLCDLNRAIALCNLQSRCQSGSGPIHTASTKRQYGRRFVHLDGGSGARQTWDAGDKGAMVLSNLTLDDGDFVLFCRIYSRNRRYTNKCLFMPVGANRALLDRYFYDVRGAAVSRFGRRLRRERPASAIAEVNRRLTSAISLFSLRGRLPWLFRERDQSYLELVEEPPGRRRSEGRDKVKLWAVHTL